MNLLKMSKDLSGRDLGDASRGRIVVAIAVCQEREVAASAHRGSHSWCISVRPRKVAAEDTERFTIETVRLTGSKAGS